MLGSHYEPPPSDRGAPVVPPAKPQVVVVKDEQHEGMQME